MYVIVDSGFWFAHFDDKDAFHMYTKKIMSLLDKDLNKIVVPWPSLYEVLNETFLKKKSWRFFFDTNIRKGKIVLVDDFKYQNDAICLSLEEKKCSLVDAIINLMLEKIPQIDTLVTFNTPDFVDTAKKNNITIIDEKFF